MYRAALALRKQHGLGLGTLEWLESAASVLGFHTDGIRVYANAGTTPVPLPAGTVLLTSGPLTGSELPADTTVWLAAE